MLLFNISNCLKKFKNDNILSEPTPSDENVITIEIKEKENYKYQQVGAKGTIYFNTNYNDKEKKGEDYKKILEEKKNRVEKEKEEKQKLNEKPEPKKVEYIDDLEEEDDPLFKIEKINLQHDKENFLALLNKPTEEVNKIMNEQNNEIKNENDGNINDNEIDIKELEFEDDNNDDMNLKVNEDLDPNKIMENKIYNINNNKKEEVDNDNTEKEKDLNNKDDNKDEDDIVDI